MPRIKGEMSILRNVDLTGEHAFGKSVAGIILQNLSDPAEFIHKTSHACVCSADHRPAIFDAAKDCVGEMLSGTGRMQKPAVVCYIDQEICAVDDESSHQIADRIFETNQRRDTNVAVRQA